LYKDLKAGSATGAEAGLEELSAESYWGANPSWSTNRIFYPCGKVS